MLPVLPLLPTNIPEPFRDWVIDIAERMQCPVDFIAVAAIVAAAAIIGAGCAVKPKQKDDWLVVPNLWGGVVGRPGMLKTPAISEVMRFINVLEAEAKQAFDESAASYYAESEFLKAEKEAIKSEMLKAQKQLLKKKVHQESYDALDLKNKLAQIQEPSKPIWKRYKTNDATIEKLSELLADNPRGLLLYRDELIGLLASWEQDGREGDRSFFLEAWNGDGSLTSDRIGRGTVHTKNLCISLFGSTQPAKLLRYLHQAIRGADNDGLLQRFQLFVYPDEKSDWRLVDRVPDVKAKQRAFDIFKTLSEMDFIQHGATKHEEGRIPYFSFEEHAQEIFYCWLTDLEKDKLRGDDHPILIEHLSKYRSLAPSLALIFYLIDLADGKKADAISIDHTVTAIAWCGYLESHAERIYGMATDMTHQAAAVLARKIEQGKLKSGFSVREVCKKDWSLLSSNELVRSACDELIETGWLRQEVKQASVGRPKQAAFVVNPKIKIQTVETENFP
ncbi:MAG: hypothetical protein A3F11_10130 [Gammaproteobacteria bacterium RIFCSPHIGHO2_12_FULL_37_14]|nr:MAG: hypothetical protein A3F11_10130 [Gammaproteobacteria bacterium RIFCSPHIGHO2_12_FULL_37_14]